MVWGIKIFLILRAWWRFSSLSLASGAIKGWDRRNVVLLHDAGEFGQALPVQH